MSQKRTPAGVPTGGEFAANAHDEATASLDPEDRRAAVSFDLMTEYGGWTKNPGPDAHFSNALGKKIIYSPYGEGWYALDRDGNTLGSWTRIEDAIEELDNRPARAIVPAPKDPELETRLFRQPVDDLDIVPGEPHPIHSGVSYGIKYNEHWGDFSVDTGYFGLQPQDHDVKPEHPLRWSSDQSSFERAAVVWQHRNIIDAALKDHGLRDKKRLRIEVESDHFSISEFDHGEFRDLIVPRRDV